MIALRVRGPNKPKMRIARTATENEVDFPFASRFDKSTFSANTMFNPRHSAAAGNAAPEAVNPNKDAPELRDTTAAGGMCEAGDWPQEVIGGDCRMR